MTLWFGACLSQAPQRTFRTSGRPVRLRVLCLASASTFGRGTPLYVCRRPLLIPPRAFSATGSATRGHCLCICLQQDVAGKLDMSPKLVQNVSVVVLGDTLMRCATANAAGTPTQRRLNTNSDDASTERDSSSGGPDSVAGPYAGASTNEAPQQQQLPYAGPADAATTGSGPASAHAGYKIYRDKKCRGDGWTAAGYDNVQTVEECQFRCDVEAGCTAFDVDFPQVAGVDCHLHTTQVPEAEHELGTLCYVKGSAAGQFLICQLLFAWSRPRHFADKSMDVGPFLPAPLLPLALFTRRYHRPQSQQRVAAVSQLHGASWHLRRGGGHGWRSRLCGELCGSSASLGGVSPLALRW